MAYEPELYLDGLLDPIYIQGIFVPVRRMFDRIDWPQRLEL